MQVCLLQSFSGVYMCTLTVHASHLRMLLCTLEVQPLCAWSTAGSTQNAPEGGRLQADGAHLET